MLTSLLLLCAQEADPGDRAAASRIARSIELHALYTGAWPASLEDLTRKSDRARFWPDGGFWFGPMPTGARWKDGRVLLAGATVQVRRPDGRAIVPPTDALRRYYTARLLVRLARNRIEEFREAHGRLPSAAEELGDLPQDPWGKPLALRFGKRFVRVSVAEGPIVRPESLTEDERRALDEGAQPRTTEADRKRIESLLDRQREDDYEARLEAEEELVGLGAMVPPILAKRLEAERDPEIRERLDRLALRFDFGEPGWKKELGPLVSAIRDRGTDEPDRICQNNLAHLWKIQRDWMVQFGGPNKNMPEKTGKEFWLELATCAPPLIDATMRDLFVCPFADVDPGDGVCTYWGPASDVNKMGDGDPVGMCDDEGHGDVVILRKSGDVQVCRKGDPLHVAALRKLKR